METDLEEYGFSKKQIQRMDEPLLDTISKYYKKVELESVSKEAIITGASRLAKFFSPEFDRDVDAIMGVADDEPAETASAKAASTSSPAALEINVKTIEEFLANSLKRSSFFMLKSMQILEEFSGQVAGILPIITEAKRKYQKLETDRDKLFIYFNSYLKKGKKTPELLASTLFSPFNSDVGNLALLIQQENPSTAEEFIEKFRVKYILQLSRVKELLYVNMLYYKLDSTLKAKNSLFDAYKNWPEKNIEKDVLLVREELQQYFFL